ncbi:MAG: hypothetical protein A2231_05300 [Candidatus Firestonebacteria bacterium RIFOXYA2_FULL_40_8]|nr:MAG: hypothetical protein A2231_05300 [Candidatus Firestonebacteria bacterium RIFOXYA2_FULL_40_8]
MKSSKITLFATLGLLLASLIWGASFYQMKDAMAFISPLPFVAVRMGAASLLLAIIALFLKKNLLNKWKAGLFLGSVLSVVMITQTVGLKYTTASNSGFITGMFVVFIPVFSYLMYKRKSSFIKLLAMGINIFGLWMLTGGLTRLNTGDVLTIITTVASGVHIVYISEVSKEEGVDLLVLCFQQLFITSLAALIISLFWGLPFYLGDGGNMARLGYIILFPTVGSFLLQLNTQKYLSTVRAGLLITTEPVFAAVFAWTLGGEKIIPMAMLGGMVMVAGMMLSEIKTSTNDK